MGFYIGIIVNIYFFFIIFDKIISVICMQEKKVVLVTGASRGLGSSIVEIFAQHGYNIILNYCTNKEKAIAVKKKMEQKYSVKVHLIQCDVSIEEEVKKMIDESVKVFGTINVLVNNAAISLDSFYREKSKSTFTKTLDVNLIGPFLVSKYASECIAKQENGAIIHIASTNGMGMGHPMSVEYDVSKAGVIALTKDMAIAYAPLIRVNAVSPGWIETDMSLCEDTELEEVFKQEESSKICLQRFGKPEEIAKVVYFLASTDASYINGSVIRVDGGVIC